MKPASQHDSETPAQGKQVITACAFIYRREQGETELFLPRRAATKKFLPNVFELPGGHIDFGEDLITGLKREIREEFELEVIVGDPFAAFTYLNPIKGSHSIEVIYFAQFSDPAKSPILHADDHSEYRWVSEKNLLAAVGNKDMDDPEIQAMYTGFNVLKK